MRADFAFGPLRKEVIHEENLDRDGAGPVRSRSNDRLGMRIQRRDVGVGGRSGTACDGVTSCGEQGSRAGRDEGSPLQAGEAKVGDKTASPPQDAKVARVASTN